MMKKIGYTTGVFDLFHIGHLNILKRAKLECDYLIVGITTDELSLSAKGTKPFIPFQERMDIVEAIKFVDEVVPQTSYDKMEAWNNLNSIECLLEMIGKEQKNGFKLKKILQNVMSKLFTSLTPLTHQALS